MAGPVVIAPNLKKTSVRIDPAGNEIDPKTKKIIKAKEPEYVPTKEEIEAKINAPKDPVPVPPEAKGKDNPLAAAIKKQVQGLVKKQIEEVMKEIDISSIVKDAINEAFK